MSYRERITMEPGKRGGKPCIRGFRITVYDILEYLAAGMTEQEILADFLIWSLKISRPAWPLLPTENGNSCRCLPSEAPL